MTKLSQRGAVLFAVLLIGAGCSDSTGDEKKSVSPTSAEAPKTGAAVTNAASAPAVAKASTEADTQWKDLQKSLRAPAPPADWQTNRPSEKEIAAFNKSNGAFAGNVSEKFRDFYTKYPDHARAKDAQRYEVELLKVAVETGNTNFQEKYDAVSKKYASSPAATENEKIGNRIEEIQRKAKAAGSDDPIAMVEQMAKGAKELVKEFPDSSEPYQFMLGIIQFSQRFRDPSKRALAMSRELVELINKGNAPDEVKEQAQMLTKRFDFLNKEIDIKFTALDGKEIDLKKMRGKVVLVDFWATWCGPCVAGLPEVKSVYDKYHSKGFEIIGISLDREKSDLVDFVKEKDIRWPQHYAGDGEQNQIAREFGINPIPELWLVDKKGIVRDQEGTTDLEGKVKKMLAE